MNRRQLKDEIRRTAMLPSYPYLRSRRIKAWEVALAYRGPGEYLWHLYSDDVEAYRMYLLLVAEAI